MKMPLDTMGCYVLPMYMCMYVDNSAIYPFTTWHSILGGNAESLPVTHKRLHRLEKWRGHRILEALVSFSFHKRNTRFHLTFSYLPTYLKTTSQREKFFFYENTWNVQNVLLHLIHSKKKKKEVPSISR